jgi:hypothetical protein
MNHINNIIDTSKYHVFYKNKELIQLAQKTISKVEKSIKECVNPPKTNKKIYIVHIKYNQNSEKKKIIISCGKYTLNTKLNLLTGENDDAFSIIYNQKEFDKFGFNLSHIKKIINKINKEELDITEQFINISNIL